MKKTLMILPLLIFAASCSKENKTPEDSTVYQTISFENHSFADKKHNNFPSASGIDSTYTEFGATFTAQNYYYSLSGILIADDYEKPQLEGEYPAYSNGKRVVCNKDFEEGKEPLWGLTVRPNTPYGLIPSTIRMCARHSASLTEPSIRPCQ